MTTNVERRFNVRDVSSGGCSRCCRLLQAMFAAAAIIPLLAFVHILPPGASDTPTASAMLQTLKSVPDQWIPPSNPPAPSTKPAQPPVAPAAAGADFGGDDVVLVDDTDSDDNSNEEEEEQQQQQQDDEQRASERKEPTTSQNYAQQQAEQQKPAKTAAKNRGRANKPSGRPASCPCYNQQGGSHGASLPVQA